MKKFFFFLFFLSVFLSFSSFVYSVSTTTQFVILPGYFYFTISGDLQDGVVLSGLKPAGDTVYQTGYWNSDKNLDYLQFFDSTDVPGFRIQMFLDGDFKYQGVHSEQGDISVSNFKIVPSWDDISGVASSPSVGVDDIFSTLNIFSAYSCKPDDLLEYSEYYDFNSDFFSTSHSKNFSTEPFDYLISQNSCKNEGRVYIGRFQLDLGIVKAGEYKSSLYIIMLDGY